MFIVAEPFYSMKALHKVVHGRKIINIYQKQIKLSKLLYIGCI
jgi:hypothetical protein